MIISEQEQNIVIQDSARQIQDTSLQKITLPADSAGIVDSVHAVKDFRAPELVVYPVDTTSVCLNNPVSDIIFPTAGNATYRIERDYSFRFPFHFIEINKRKESENTGTLRMYLKEGEKIPSRPFHDDWIILLVIASAFIYVTLSAFYGKIFHNVRMFISFKGINDASSRDTKALFHWQSNLFNFISFANTALFIYCVADYYDFNPFGISGFVLWFIFIAVIAVTVTLRFIICSIIGKISGEDEALNEYSVTVYQSYRVQGFILFFIIILLSYTTLLASKPLLLAGFILIPTLYLMRISRLLLIFLKRNISILYLILYLCALEFLPVLMLVKYFSNLF